MRRESVLSSIRSWRKAKILPAVLLMSLIVSGCSGGPDGSDKPDTPDPVTAVVQRVGPSVVNIQTNTGDGSGVIFSNDGYIVTNDHVIRDADISQLEVSLLDMRTMKATLVGTDPRKDIAVIKVTAENLQAAEFADSKKVRSGDDVIAIGNPLSVKNSVTKGIISNVDIEINTGTNINRYLQTDAPLNPGNSGGALFNMTGKVVGINDLSRKGAEGMHYAIPSNDAKESAEQIIDKGYVSVAYIGVAGKNSQTNDGEGFILVEDLMPKSPAKEAGLEKGDVIYSVNNVRVETVSKLREQLDNIGIGSMVSLGIARQSKQGLQRGIIQVKIEELPKALIYPIDWS